MNIAKKKLKVTCIFHKGCMDGWMSALPIWFAYHQTAELKFIPAHYSDTPPVVDEDDYVFIVDFSYKPEVIANWYTGNAEVFLLDHHTKAIQELVDSPLLGLKKIGYQQALYDSDKLKLSAYLAFNDDKPHSQQCSGSGLVMDFLYKYRDSIQAGQFTTEVSDELTTTIPIAQSYDLWHHDGEEMHPNTFLSMFFKKWETTNREKFNRMQKHPEESHALMMELVNDWRLTSLQQKLDYGKSVTIEHGIKCRALCETAYEIKLPVEKQDIKIGYVPGDVHEIKIGYIPGDKLDVSVSTLGSIAVREYGWDVMVMTAAMVEDKRVLTMRSFKDGANIDVAHICAAIAEGPYGVSGGGHRNAAGCTIYDRDTADVLVKALEL